MGFHLLLTFSLLVPCLALQRGAPLEHRLGKGRIRKNDLISVKVKFPNGQPKSDASWTQWLALTLILAREELRPCATVRVRTYNSPCTKACCRGQQKRHAFGMRSCCQWRAGITVLMASDSEVKRRVNK